MIEHFFQGRKQPEINDAFEVRKVVFIDEQGFEADIDELDDNAYHMVLYDHAKPVATGRLIIVSEQQAKIGRVAVLSSYRGKKVGLMLMKALIQKAQALQITQLSLSSQLQAQAFYQKVGFAPCSEVYLEEGVEHIYMCYQGEK